MSAYSQKRTFEHFLSSMDSLHHERYALSPGSDGVKRRLAAILATDVVGYSRLMGEDEAGTLERLKSLRRELVQPKITGGRGRIVKFMGDGLLAEFPSVVEAVKCAVDIQQDMRAREAEIEIRHLSTAFTGECPWT